MRLNFSPRSLKSRLRKITFFGPSESKTSKRLGALGRKLYLDGKDFARLHTDRFVTVELRPGLSSIMRAKQAA
jgi:hypothetical protein